MNTQIGFGNFEESFFDLEVLKTSYKHRFVYMGIEPVKQCVDDLIKSEAYKSLNLKRVKLQLSGFFL